MAAVEREEVTRIVSAVYKRMKQGLPITFPLASCIPYIIEVHSCHDNEVTMPV